MANWKEDVWLTRLIASQANVIVTLIDNTRLEGRLIGADLNSIVIKVVSSSIADAGIWIPKSSVLNMLGSDIQGG